MRGGLLDTNILLYAANRDCREYSAARAFLEKVRSIPGQWFLTEGICYEFLRVSTHHRVFPSPLPSVDALNFLKAVIETPTFSVLSAGPRHWETLHQVVKNLHAPSGNLFFDIRTAALMKEHGVHVIYTADTDFLQFSTLEVINPISV
jgi:toxin-antitoxin system PIN domain toxin